MAGHVAVQDSSPVVGQEEEAVENSKRDGVYGEKVHGRDRFPVILQERSPLVHSLGISWCPLHPARDGALRNIKAEHLQLPMDARSTPSRALGHHAKNEFPQPLAGPSPAETNLMPGEPRPIPAKASPMPTDHGFWAYQDERALPAGPKPSSQLDFLSDF